MLVTENDHFGNHDSPAPASLKKQFSPFLKALYLEWECEIWGDGGIPVRAGVRVFGLREPLGGLPLCGGKQQAPKS